MSFDVEEFRAGKEVELAPAPRESPDGVRTRWLTG